MFSKRNKYTPTQLATFAKENGLEVFTYGMNLEAGERFGIRNSLTIQQEERYFRFFKTEEEAIAWAMLHTDRVGIFTLIAHNGVTKVFNKGDNKWRTEEFRLQNTDQVYLFQSKGKDKDSGKFRLHYSSKRI